MATQEIGLLTDEEVIAWHRNFRPLKLKRMNWQEHPVLVSRRRLEAPKVSPLPPLKDMTLGEPAALDASEIHLDDPDTLVASVVRAGSSLSAPTTIFWGKQSE